MQLAELSIPRLDVMSVVINFSFGSWQQISWTANNSGIFFGKLEALWITAVSFTNASNCKMTTKTIVTYIDLNLLHRNCVKEYKIADEWNKHCWNWYTKGLFFLHMVQQTFGCIFFVWFSVSVFDTEYVICVTWEGECLKYFNDTVVFHYTQNLPLGCTDTRTSGWLCSV